MQIHFLATYFMRSGYGSNIYNKVWWSNDVLYKCNQTQEFEGVSKKGYKVPRKEPFAWDAMSKWDSGRYVELNKHYPE